MQEEIFTVWKKNAIVGLEMLLLIYAFIYIGKLIKSYVIINLKMKLF